MSKFFTRAHGFIKARSTGLTPWLVGGILLSALSQGAIWLITRDSGTGGGGETLTVDGFSVPTAVAEEGAEYYLIAKYPDGTMDLVEVTALVIVPDIEETPSPTPPGIPNAETVTPTPIVPRETPSQVSPAAPTITPLPTGGAPIVECDQYPCTAYADDLFLDGVSFRFRATSEINLRICPSILCDRTGPRTVAGVVYNVWAIYIKSPGADSERWACIEQEKHCNNWFAIQGDFRDPFGVIERLAVDVTPY